MLSRSIEFVRCADQRKKVLAAAEIDQYGIAMVRVCPLRL